MNDVEHYIKSLLELRLDVPDDVLNRLMQDKLVREVLGQQRRHVFFVSREDGHTWCSAQQVQDAYDQALLVRVQNLDGIAVSKRALARSFQLLDFKSAAVDLFDLVSPLKDALQSGGRGVPGVRRALEVFTDQLRGLEGENLLREIPWISEICDLNETDTDKIRVQMETAVYQIEALRKTRFPGVQAAGQRIDEAMGPQDAAKVGLDCAKKELSFFVAFYQRLDEAVQRAQKALQADGFREFLTSVCAEAPSLTLLRLQLDSTRPENAFLQAYKDLIPQIQMLLEGSLERFDLQRALQALEARQGEPDCGEDLRRLFSCIYVVVCASYAAGLSEDAAIFSQSLPAASQESQTGRPGFLFLGRQIYQSIRTERLQIYLKALEKFARERPRFQPQQTLLLDGMQRLEAAASHLQNVSEAAASVPELGQEAEAMREAIAEYSAALCAGDAAKLAAKPAGALKQVAINSAKGQKTQSGNVVVAEPAGEDFLGKPRFASLLHAALLAYADVFWSVSVRGDGIFRFCAPDAVPAVADALGRLGRGAAAMALSLSPEGLSLQGLLREYQKLAQLESLSVKKKETDSLSQKPQAFAAEIAAQLTRALRLYRPPVSAGTLEPWKQRLSPESLALVEHAAHPLLVFRPCANPLGFAALASETLQQLKDIQVQAKSEPLRELVSQVEKLVCSEETMVQLVSPLSQIRRRRLHVENWTPLLRLSPLKATPVPEFSQHDRDVHRLRQLFLQQKGVLEPRPLQQFTELRALFNAIESTLVPAASVVSEALRTLEEAKVPVCFGEMMRRQKAEVLKALADIPQYCVKGTQGIAVYSTLSIAYKAQRKQSDTSPAPRQAPEQVLPFYGVFMDEELVAGSQKFSIHTNTGSDENLTKQRFQDLMVRLIQNAFDKAIQFEELAQKFVAWTSQIQESLEALRFASLDTVPELVATLRYTLDQMTVSLNADPRAALSHVVARVFAIIGEQFCLFSHHMLGIFDPEFSASPDSEYGVQVGPLVESLSHQNKDRAVNLQLQAQQYAQQFSKGLHTSLSLQDGKVVFEPAFESVASATLSLPGKLLQAFFGHRLDLCGLTVSDVLAGAKQSGSLVEALCFPVQNEDDQLKELRKAVLLTTKALSLRCVHAIKECWAFAEVYQHHGILFNTQSRAQLKELLGNSLEAWCEQCALLRASQRPGTAQGAAVFGVIQVRYGAEFQREQELQLAQLRQFLEANVEETAQVQVTAVEAAQHGAIEKLEPYTTERLEALLNQQALSGDLFALLEAITAGQDAHIIYLKHNPSLLQARECIKSVGFSRQISQLSQDGTFLQKKTAEVARFLSESGRYAHLMQKLQEHDAALSKEAAELIRGWPEFLATLQEARECDFASARVQIQAYAQKVSDCLRETKRLGPALVALGVLGEGGSQRLSFMCTQHGRALEAISQETHSYAEQVCPALGGVVEEFFGKIQRRLGAFVPDDVLYLAKELQVKAKQLPKTVLASAFWPHLEAWVGLLCRVAQIVSQLAAPKTLKVQHWRVLQQKISPMLSGQDAPLKDVFDAYLKGARGEGAVLKTRLRATEEVLQQANGQRAVEAYIEEVANAWEDMRFCFYSDGTIQLISKWQTYAEPIEEHLSGLVGLQSSPYYPDFSRQVEEWRTRLNTLAEVLNTWADVQKRWVYLHSVFAANAQIVNTHLGSVREKLAYANGAFQGCLSAAVEDPVVIKVLEREKILETLQQIGVALEDVQKALGSFLEQQRAKSPRLYFVGDDDLLDIISVTSSTSSKGMQKHWKKMFSGVDRALFEEQEQGSNLSQQQESIAGVFSRQGELISFPRPISPSKTTTELAVHPLLAGMEAQITAALKHAFIQSLVALTTGPAQAAAAFQNLPCQTVVLALQALWTELVMAAFADKKERKKMLAQALAWTDNMITTIVTAQLESKREFARSIFVSELTHLKNAVAQLAESQNPEYDWSIQLKFTISRKGQECADISTFISGLANEQTTQVEVSCRMGDAVLPYGFEYHGTEQRIVQTQLTDQCYLVAMHAVQDKLGCAPQGKAGTGKTESARALALQLGRPVLVFNTDENFNEQAVGRILAGVCEVGAFVIFDEFNRLEEGALSAVSQQLSIIQQGLRIGAAEVPNFVHGSQRKSIVLKPNTAIFVTMNPGYAGRRELPETLKALLRDVAMNAPDLTAIAEVMLGSNGFTCASGLARKIIPFFQLAAQQTSPQAHYDWGLRAIKAVLSAAGQVLKKMLVTTSAEEPRASVEARAVVSAVVDSVVPKLVEADVSIFESLMRDVFPGSSLASLEDEEFTRVVEAIVEERGLVRSAGFVRKAQQLRRCTQVSMGVMLVGGPGVGKSAVLRVFCAALERLGGRERAARFFLLCPKAFSGKEDLFGSLDPATREWADGQFTTVLRGCLEEISQEAETGPAREYVICFDSQIDPEYVESLNSVLDDNRCLTLPNGERLAVPPNIHILFEVEDLRNATPATVSRCSMVWFSPGEAVTPGQRFEGFLRQTVLNHSLPENQPAALRALLQAVTAQRSAHAWRSVSAKLEKDHGAFAELLRRLYRCNLPSQEVMQFGEARLMGTVLSLLEAALREAMNYIQEKYMAAAARLPAQGLIYNEETAKTALEAVFLPEHVLAEFMQKRFMLALAWGFASAHSNQNRFRVAEIVQAYFAQRLGRELLDGLKTDFSDPDNTSNTILQYNVRLTDPVWRHNSALIPKTVIQEHQIGSCVVPTLDTITYGYLIEAWLSGGRPLILVGPAGSGKSMSLASALKQLPGFETLFVSFSSSTTPEYLKKLLLRSCEKVFTPQGVVLQPRTAGTTLVVMCDEVNLPAPDAYGCQRAVEFLRTAVENRSFYDAGTKQTYLLQRIAFASTCNPPTDPGRHALCGRFLGLCPVFLCDFPTRSSLELIYGAFVGAVFRGRSFAGYPTDEEKGKLADATAGVMVALYSKVAGKLTSERQPHYIYSPRELTRWSRALQTGLPAGSSIAVEGLARLVLHEGLRLFQDRLVLPEEREWLLSEAVNIVQTGYSLQEGSSLLVDKRLNPPLFSFLNAEKTYLETSLEAAEETLKETEKEFWQERALTDPLAPRVHLREETIKTILKIDRVLRQPVGHLLLVGVPGVGKTLLASMAAFLNSYAILEVKPHRKYTIQDFEEELRAAIIKAGVRGQPLAFLFDEASALETTFLEHMNALLASGEVPGLFEGDTLARLLALAREAIDRSRQDEADAMLPPHGAKDDEVLAWVTRRVQQNLHVVFSMNPPRQAGLQNTAASSPALFNRCVIVWLGDWAPTQLYQMAKSLLQDALPHLKGAANHTDATAMFANETKSLDELRTNLLAPELPQVEKLARSAVLMHMVAQQTACDAEAARMTGLPVQLLDGLSQKVATPRHFVRAISLLGKRWERAVATHETRSSHVRRGLGVLRETRAQVAEMQTKLSQQTIQLEEARSSADAMLGDMASKKAEAQAKRTQTNKLVSELEVKQGEIQAKKGPIQAELAKAQPAVDAAKRAIAGVDKKKLDEIRSLAKPPEPIRIAMEAVLLIVGSDEDRGNLGWENVRRALKRQGFVESILAYDPEVSVAPAEVVARLERDYFSKMTKEQVYRASAAAGPMYDWAVSVMGFQVIVKKIQPLTDEIQAIETEALELQETLERANAELESLAVLIKQYEDQYKQLLKKQTELDNQKHETSLQLKRASGLVESLGEEAGRWEAQTAEFSLALENSLGDEVLCSFYQTYAMAYPEQVRHELITEWNAQLESLGTPTSSGFDSRRSVFSLPEETARWTECGLPQDAIFEENLSALFSLSRQEEAAEKTTIKLLMDSPGLLVNLGEPRQMVKVLSDILGKTALIASALDTDFPQVLERALRFGAPLVVTNAEDFDPILNDCLDFATQVGAHCGFLSPRRLRIAGREIDAAQGFKLLLVLNSQAGQRAIPAQVLSKLTVLNFTLTQKGLSGSLQQQLLDYERPDVGAERRALLRESSALEARLLNLERKLLEIIGATDAAALLRDDSVSDALLQTKKEAKEAQEKRAEAERLCAQLEETLQFYTEPANLAADLFFFLQRCSQLRCNARFSQALFQKAFDAALKAICLPNVPAIAAAESTPPRMRVFARRLIAELYATVASALSQEDRLAFQLGLLLEIWGTPGAPAALGFEVQPLDATARRLILESVAQIYASKAHTPQELLEVLAREQPRYAERARAMEEAVEKQEVLESTAETALDDFVIVAAADPVGLPQYIPALLQLLLTPELGPMIHGLSLSELCQRMDSHRVPYLISTLGGADLSAVIGPLARDAALKTFAVGQKECSIAQIKQACSQSDSRGLTIVVDNLHLAGPRFCEGLLTLFQEELSKNNKLRAIFTAKLSPHIPASVYEGSAKLCVETPLSLGLQAQRTYQQLVQQIPPQSKLVQRLVVCASLVHSVITLRSRYIPAGFIQDYAYTAADVEAVGRVLRQKLTNMLGQTLMDIEDLPISEIQENIIRLCYGNKVVYERDGHVIAALIRLIISRDALATGKIAALGISLPPLEANDQAIIEELSKMPDSILSLGLQPSVQRALSERQINQTLAKAALIGAMGRKELKLGVQDEGADLIVARLQKWLDELAPVQTQELAPKLADLEKTWLSNVAAALRDEISKAVNAAALVRKDLSELIAYLNHIAPKTNLITSLLTQISAGATPREWKDITEFGAEKINTFVPLVAAKLHYIHQCASAILTNPDTLLFEHGLNLGLLYQPAAMLTSLRQIMARKLDAALDEVSVKYVLHKPSSETACVKFVGIGVMFGRMEEGCLAVEDSMLTRVDSVYAEYSNVEAQPTKATCIPVYLDQSRKIVVFGLHVPCEDVTQTVISSAACVLRK